MQDPSDDMLMALADDQLQGVEAEALRRQIARDPALAARFAMFSETRRSLEQAFAADSSADHLIAVIHAAPMGGAEPKTETAEGRVIPFPARKRQVTGLAVAASLVLTFGLGGYFLRFSESPSAGSLAAAALSELPTGSEVTLPGGGTARALASYETKVGLCRLIETQSEDIRSERLVACRQDSTDWQIYVSVAASDAALTLSPLDPLLYAFYGVRAEILMQTGDYDAAARFADKAASTPGAHYFISMIALAAYGLAGRHDQLARWKQSRKADVTAEHYFTAFPLRESDIRRRVSDVFRLHGL